MADHAYEPEAHAGWRLVREFKDVLSSERRGKLSVRIYDARPSRENATPQFHLALPQDLLGGDRPSNPMLLMISTLPYWGSRPFLHDGFWIRATPFAFGALDLDAANTELRFMLGRYEALLELFERAARA